MEHLQKISTDPDYNTKMRAKVKGNLRGLSNKECEKACNVDSFNSPLQICKKSGRTRKSNVSMGFLH